MRSEHPSSSSSRLFFFQRHTPNNPFDFGRLAVGIVAFLLLMAWVSGQLRREERATASTLQTREQEFQQMADNIQEIFWVIDAETKKALYVNHAYETITGRRRRFLTENPSSYVPEDLHDPRHWRARWSCFHSDGVSRLAVLWQDYPLFKENLRGNLIKVLTLQEMLSELYRKTNTPIAPSEVGRLLQVIKASGWTPAIAGGKWAQFIYLRL